MDRFFRELLTMDHAANPHGVGLNPALRRALKQAAGEGPAGTEANIVSLGLPSRFAGSQPAASEARLAQDGDLLRFPRQAADKAASPKEIASSGKA